MNIPPGKCWPVNVFNLSISLRDCPEDIRLLQDDGFSLGHFPSSSTPSPQMCAYYADNGYTARKGLKIRWSQT